MTKIKFGICEVLCTHTTKNKTRVHVLIKHTVFNNARNANDIITLWPQKLLHDIYTCKSNYIYIFFPNTTSTKIYELLNYLNKHVIK